MDAKGKEEQGRYSVAMSLKRIASDVKVPRALLRLLKSSHYIKLEQEQGDGSSYPAETKRCHSLPLY
jgi:hypothetical protein